MTELVDAQIAREERASDRGRANALRKIQLAVQKGSVDSVPASGRLLARLHSLVMEDLRPIVEKTARGPGAALRGWLRELPLDVLAMLVLRSVVQQTLSRQPHTCTVQALGIALGKAIVLEVAVRQVEKLNPVYIEKTLSYLKASGTQSESHTARTMRRAVANVIGETAEKYQLPQRDFLSIGKHGLQACLNAGIVHIQRVQTKRGTAVTFHLDDSIRDSLVDNGSAFARFSMEPMLAPPQSWSNNWDGGYYTSDMRMQAPLLNAMGRTREVRELRKQGLQDAERVLNVANYLQSIPYRVHRPTAEMLLKVWAAGGAAMGLPALRMRPKPQFPFEDKPKEAWDERDQEDFDLWKAEMAEWYRDERKHKSLALATSALAQHLRELGDSELYYPARLDFRQRFYYTGSPNLQGQDSAKACLHFAEKKPLGQEGVFWLKVSIANCFGLDKDAFEARAKWTTDNWELLVQGLQDPVDAPLWRECKDAPFGAYAAVWELNQAYLSGDPTSYCTGVPVHMDATCSGLQHFSALLRDPVGAYYTNLTSENIDAKADIYQRVAGLAEDKVASIAGQPMHPDFLEARVWQDLGVERSLAKGPVMTYVYGATLRGAGQGCALYLRDKDIEVPEGSSRLRAGMFLARILFASIAEAVPAAAAAMKWLQECMRQVPRDRVVSWKNPVGWTVVQAYDEVQEERVAIRSCGLSKVTLQTPTGMMDGTRMRNAVCPNFIHALDAAHLTLVAERMQAEAMQMVAIHDSFGTHPCDVGRMLLIVKERMVHLYKDNDPLGLFLNGLGVDMERPLAGSFVIDDILNAKFTFC